jgi:hypothetical protein
MSSVVFRDRGFLAKPVDGLVFDVERYSWSAKGGPFKATIKVTGDPLKMREMLTWLRYAVEIFNDRGKGVWWGYVESVEIAGRYFTRRSTLDGLYNRVAVAYTSVAVGQETIGVRGTTAWAEDADSVREFGKRELLDSFSGTTQTVAVNLRNRKLAKTRFPKILKVRETMLAPGQEETATITCRGWWTTLEWQYCTIPTRLAMAAWQWRGARPPRPVGATAANLGLMQTFSLTGATNVLQVGVYGRKIGSPTDNLSLAIYSLTSDVPNQSLGSANLSGVLIQNTSAELLFTFSSNVALSANTQYGLVLSRSTGDIDDYFLMPVDVPGYGGGILRQGSGSSWSTLAGESLAFRIYANDMRPTSTQMENIISTYGEFINTVRVLNASGVSSDSYRNGTYYALDEIEDLMEAGTANNRRLLANVDIYRNVAIYEEPAGECLPGGWDAGSIHLPVRNLGEGPG